MNKKSLVPLGVASAILLSAALWISCFPPFTSTEAAWCSLAGLILILRPQLKQKAFLVAYLTGLIYWVATLYWLRHVTYFGWFLLAAYCAFYTGLFGWLFQKFWKHNGDETLAARLRLMFIAAVLWVGLDWFRSFIGTGFPWNFLAVSQAHRTSLIQVTSIGGVHLLTFLIVFFNAGLAFTILRYIQLAKTGRRVLHVELVIPFLLIAATTFYGLHVVKSTPATSQSIRVGLVQPAIPQYQKWTREFVSEIYRRLWEWTEQVHAVGKIDLIVWPETSVPDDILESEASMHLVTQLTTNGVPLLVGSMDVAWPDEGNAIYYNSTFLFSNAGQLLERYDKQHLVLFGEYIPYHKHLQRFFELISKDRGEQFLTTISPIAVSFTPGKKTGLMTLPDSGIVFSPLICFEDTVSRLGRKAVKGGARLLVNQTNDAWFDPSAGSRQHMMQAVFRAVENRVPLIRACNTGVTGIIDRFGRPQQILQDGKGEVQFEGFLIGEVLIPGEEFKPTFYTRYGDWFGSSCGLGVLILLWTTRPKKKIKIEHKE